jgi:hypothetical protein
MVSLNLNPAIGRTLVVALGLLGEHLPYEVVNPSRDDYDSAAAWVLSVSAALGSAAGPELRNGFISSTGPARRICQAAMASGRAQSRRVAPDPGGSG